MENIPNYTEEQKLSRSWIQYSLVIATLLIIGCFFYQKTTGNMVGNNPISNRGYIILIIILTLSNILVFTLRMKTVIDTKGISVRFFPGELFSLNYKWTAISNATVREYAAIAEFGGWGFRYSFKRGFAYIVSGDHGIQLQLKSGKKVLIGTHHPDEIELVLNQFLSNSNDGPAN